MDGSIPPNETFARYYVRYLIARKGFKLVAEHEARQLLNYCGFVLTRTEGSCVVTVGIIDREAHPENMFSMPVDEFQGLVTAYQNNIERLQRRRMTTSISIYEIGPRAISRESKRRLASYRLKASGLSTVARAVDTASKRVWSGAMFGSRSSFDGPVGKLLRSRRLSPAQLSQPTLGAAAQAAFPIFTFTMLALLGAIFACESSLGSSGAGGSLTPSLATLQMLGGLSHPLVIDGGQWWRLFTAPLLHADIAHIGFNCFALFLIGRLLEPRVGWRWSAAIFAVSAICGSLISLLVNPANLIGVGASGGIVGLFAAALVIAGRLPAGGDRTRLVTQAFYGLVPAFLPFLNAVNSGSKIDYGAHFGGALGGVAMGLVLVLLWSDDLARPRWSNLGAFLAVAFFAAAASGTFSVARTYAGQAVLASAFPTTSAGQYAQADQLVRDYPHDPRARLVHALALLRKNDRVGAEADLRAGLAEGNALKYALSPAVEGDIRALLAGALYDDGKKDEAGTISRPACATVNTGYFSDLLHRRRLCS